MRSSITILAAAVLVLVGSGPGSAASPAPSSGRSGGSDPARELVVEIEMLAPCPSVLGCTHELELQGPSGQIQLPISLDGADHTEARPARFAVAAGTHRLSLATSMPTFLATGASESASSSTGLASCAVDLAIPETTGAVTVRGWVTAAPTPGDVGPDDPDPTGWSCALSDLDQPARPAPSPSVVVPIRAVACSLSQVSWDQLCARAVAASVPIRRAFAVAPLAVASPDCPGRERCEIARWAVAFATREGDAWSWSETLRVTVAPGGAYAVPWPSDRPLPRRFPVLQDRYDLGGRLGEAVPIPTSDPPPEGQAPVCLTAEVDGTVFAHPDWGVALVSADGLHRVTWPAGWTARRAPEGVVLVDATGETVAREGQLIRLDGGETAPGEWVTCGDITQPDPD
jgi:hypothetical protein